MKNAILINNKLPKKFWTEAMAIITYLKNFFSVTFKKKVLKEI